VRVGVISVFMDYMRRGEKNHRLLQPQIGSVIASLLPASVDIDVINETVEDPDWARDYDLLFLSSLHSDFDRARQISHYWRRRGAATVYGGPLASTYPALCQPFFDAVVVGDADGIVPRLFADFCRGEMRPLYVSDPHAAAAAPVPRFDLVARKMLAPLSFEATRGCPFTCEFCILTALGTRYQPRSPALVVRDIREGQRLLGELPRYRRRFVNFLDNNIGGSLPHLARLCEALAPLGVRWGAQITFNAIAKPAVVAAMARSGCSGAYVGLESFNPAALSDMGKFQNAIDETRDVLERCHRHGILVASGLLVSSETDNWAYVERIPYHLRESGLHVPSFICFETPFPGTPYFHRLMAEERPAFLPNALLRDFTGYTLVVRPKREPLHDFVEAYKWVIAETYSKAARARKVAHDARRLLARGHWFTAGVDLGQVLTYADRPDPRRSYVAGTDTPPPEATSVPFTAGDFDSEAERRTILEPWRVTDGEGRVLPIWRSPTKVFDRKGGIAEEALALVNTA
jgi:hypothetical protein